MRAPAATEAGLQKHTGSGRHWPTPRIDHFPGHIASRNVRQRNAHAIETATLPEIEVIEGAGLNANDRAPGCGNRVWRVFVLKDLRSSVRVEADGLHAAVRSTGAPKPSVS